MNSIPRIRLPQSGLIRPLVTSCSSQLSSVSPQSGSRPLHQSARLTAHVGDVPVAPPDVQAVSRPRWLTNIKDRLGACIHFGCKGDEIVFAGMIAKTIANEWRGLVAGAEGFHVQDHPASTEVKRANTELRNASVENARWGDMDSMVRHVNNTIYLRYAETSRVKYCRSLARHCPWNYRSQWDELCTPRSIGLIYKHSELDYLLPVKYPDRMTVCHRLADLPPEGSPMSVIPTHVCVLSHTHQRNALRVYEENVVYDYGKSKRVELPTWMENVFRKAAREEQLARAYWLERRQEVEGWVQQLEASSIFSGREEDMGNTGKYEGTQASSIS